MISDLTPAQKVLAEYMSYLSEEAFSATWMDDLEFKLWQLMNGEIEEYGRLDVTIHMINKLKELSARANGWIIFDDEKEETYLTWKSWEKLINN
ncbi:MAG: hypothetical protein Mars2KO_41520 [Maribacter sp.]